MSMRKILTFASGGRRLVTTAALRVDPYVILNVSSEPFDDPSIVMRAGTLLIRSGNLIGMFQLMPHGLSVDVMDFDDKTPIHLNGIYVKFFTYLIITRFTTYLFLVPKFPEVKFIDIEYPYIGKVECKDYNQPQTCTLKLSKFFEKYVINITDVKDLLLKGHPYPAAFNAALIVNTPIIFSIQFDHHDIRTMLNALLSFLYEIEDEEVTAEEARAGEKAALMLKNTYKSMVEAELNHVLNLYAILSEHERDEGSGGEAE